MHLKKASGILIMGGMLAGICILSALPAYAVIGDLNYNMPGTKQGDTVVVDNTDTKSLNACKEEKSRTDTLLKNCQGANALLTSTQEELKNGKTTLLIVSIASGIIALVFAATTVLLFLKLKKAQAPVSSAS